MNYQEILAEYNDLMTEANRYRKLSLSDPEARAKYESILESPKFQELENILLNNATDKREPNCPISGGSD